MSKPAFTPPEIQLQCREIEFDCPETFTQIWLADNYLESHFFNLISVNTDVTEAFAMRTMRQALPQLKELRLLDNAKLFIKQEGAHRRLHHKLNAALIAWGYARIPLIIQKQYDEFFHLLEPGGDFSAALRVACLLENLSAYVFRRFSIVLEEKCKAIDPMMAYLFGYHAAEELEHKSVCFDCYTSIYGHRPTEHSAHPSEWQSFNKMVFENLYQSMLYFMMIDQLKAGKKIDVDEKKLREQFFGVEGVFPPNSDYEAYNKPDFHPWQIDDRDFIQQWDNHWASYFYRQVVTQ